MRSALKLRLDRIARGAPPPVAAAPTESVATPPQEVLTTAPPEVLYRRLRPRAEAPSRPPPPAATDPAALHRLAPGREVPAPGGGAAWLHEEVLPIPAVAEGLPGDLLFLDLETTGLGSFPLFLAGLLSRREGRFELRQYLARTYAEEGAVISLFLAEAKGAATLASFNGRSFDLPQLRARAAACGVPFALDRPHRDLLPECRRAFAGRLPDCRLTTLEHHVLGRPRVADLPGREVPPAYHAYVRTGDARDLARILAHNRDDLLALASLAALLGPGPPAPVRPSDTTLPPARRCGTTRNPFAE